MLKRLFLGLAVTAVFFNSVVIANAGDLAEVSLTDWTARKYDEFKVDIDNNIGYLIHDDGSYLKFPVVTGQKRYVYYIGRYYFAGTPKKKWVAKELNVKGDRVTFGTKGEFFRLFDNEKGSTSYGIHSHKYIEQMIKSDNRYRSMGCILVIDDILKVINQTFEVNSNELKVETY